MERIIHKVETSPGKLPARLRVAAYCRVSTEKETMQKSLSAQISHYSGIIQKNLTWQYAGVYADEGITGTKDNRAEFLRLLSDARAGKIDIILTKSISRFGRNTLNLLKTVRELKDLGVDIWFERENIKTKSAEGELLLTVLASFAQAESEAVSENCKWRIRQRLSKGELVSLRHLYGYTIEKYNVEINTKQAKIVNQIFNEYVNGMGCKEIASFLNSKKVKSLNGGKWTADRIAKMLRNEKYIGDAMLQKKYVKDHLTKKDAINHGELPRYYVTHNHPPIISKELYTLANQKMDGNAAKSKGTSKKTHHPLSGLLFCEACGAAYTRKTTHHKSAWVCSTYKNKGKDACLSKRIPEDILFHLCTEVIKEDAFDDIRFRDKVERITAAGDILSFHLKGNKKVNITWSNTSRKEVWTESMKDSAKERSLKQWQHRKS